MVSGPISNHFHLPTQTISVLSKTTFVVIGTASSMLEVGGSVSDICTDTYIYIYILYIYVKQLSLSWKIGNSLKYVPGWRYCRRCIYFFHVHCLSIMLRRCIYIYIYIYIIPLAQVSRSRRSETSSSQVALAIAGDSETAL